MARNKKSYFTWGLAIVGYYCWFQAFYNAVRFGNMLPYSDFTDFIVGVVENFTPILFISLANLLIVFRLSWVADVRKKICADIVLSLIACLLLNCLYVAIYCFVCRLDTFDTGVIDWAGSLLNDTIILLCVELVYYFTRMLRLRQEADEVARQLILYQYDALKAQVNPHFLFNSLNILYSLVSIDTDKSKSFIRELAKMYRYVVAQQNKETVSVREELDFLSAYVYVLKIRYNNQFDVIVKGEPNYRASLVPFTLQLLIENVTKHNIISSQQSMQVTVDLQRHQIVVSNPKHPREVESGERIGLKYLSKLYAQHGCQFRIESRSDVFIAYIPFIIKPKHNEIRNY